MSSIIGQRQEITGVILGSWDLNPYAVSGYERRAIDLRMEDGSIENVSFTGSMLDAVRGLWGPISYRSDEEFWSAHPTRLTCEARLGHEHRLDQKMWQRPTKIRVERES